MESRRAFLAGLVVAGASGLAGASQQVPAPPNPSAPPRSQLPGQNPEGDIPPMPNPDKKILENNDKDMKKKVEQLFELAKALKDEVENTDSSKVLSVNLMKKAEEIEKLAHDIRNRSRG